MPTAKQHHTAILLFAHDPKSEASSKRLSPLKKANRQIAELLLQKTWEAAKSTGLPVIHIHSAEQQGETFGERFANAVQQVFSLGYQKVIAVGSDSPQLSQSHLLNAYQALQEGKSVLGPSVDGGTYLVGLHKVDFDIESFRSITWRAGKDFRELNLILTQKGKKIHTLEKLWDIDHTITLQLLLDKQLLALSLHKALLRWVGLPQVVASSVYQANLFQKNYLSTPSQRGPPASSR